MWERLVRSPRGRISARKFIMLLTTLVVACFLYTSLVGSSVFAAATASWSGNNISLEGNTYTPFTPQSGDGLPSDTTYYKFGPRSGSNVAKFIEFPSGSTPQQATSANLQNFQVSGSNFSNPSNLQPITLTPAGQQSANTNSANVGTTSCAVEGIGWIICPVSNFLAKGMDLVYGYIQSFLAVQPLATTQDNAMYRAWSYMRNFANIAFVIGFMVVIYSQLTSIGLSNYNIKKILPRFVVAAILVNISYWICAIAVDVFNILGYSVQDLFIQVRNSLVGNEGNSWHVGSWQSLTSFVLAGGSGITGVGVAGYLGLTTAATVAVTAGVSGLIILLFPMLLGLTFVVLMTFLILAARQAIITILIVLAPLAFVAYLLPNTEKWFNRWRDTFLTLLFVFPAFSAVYAGAQLAASVIIQNATTVNAILLGMAVQVAPLAITPLLLKLGGGALHRFAGIVNNPTKGIFDRGKNWARNRTEQNMSAGQARLAQMRKAARDRGLKGMIKVDKDGNAILDSAGNPVSHYKHPLHPYNMAHHRDYDRRRREGLKSAHDAMSEGLFTQTIGGRQIHDLTKDASLEKHAGESANSRRYDTAMHTSATVQDRYRRDLHHQAHIDEGVGKAYEEALTNHAERDLQAQINDPAGPLRNVKIHADVDAAHAQFLAANVAAEGKHEFKEQVMADRALRLMNVQTNEHEKAAATLDNTLQERANAHWERLSRTDANLQQIRLAEVEASDSHKKAEEQWKSLVENIRAVGVAAPELAPQNARAARTIQTLTQDIETQSLIQNNAKVEQAKRRTEELLSNLTLRNEAGGIRGDAGAESVLASAVATSRKEYGERVAEKTQLSRHFNLSSAQRQQLAMGYDVPAVKNGVRYVFRAADEYARESAIEDQLKMGSFGDIEQIIESSGAGGENYDYRTTIRDAITSNGLTSKALYWGSKIIDDVGQGNYSPTVKNDAIVYHIGEGKIKAENLATQSPAAARSLFEIVNDTARMDAMTPTQRTEFMTRYQHLREAAWSVMHNDVLKARADDGTKEVLEQFMIEPTE